VISYNKLNMPGSVFLSTNNFTFVALIVMIFRIKK